MKWIYGKTENSGGLKNSKSGFGYNHKYSEIKVHINSIAQTVHLFQTHFSGTGVLIQDSYFLLGNGYGGEANSTRTEFLDRYEIDSFRKLI